MSNENPRSTSPETSEGKLFAELVNASDSEITDCKFEGKPYSPASTYIPGTGPLYTEGNGPGYEWSSLKAMIKGHSVEFSEQLDFSGGGMNSSVSIDGVDLEGDYDHNAADALQQRLSQIADKASK